MILNTYIVRIYRRKNGIPHNLVGVVEEVGKKEKRAFSNLDDLWEILKCQAEMGAHNRRTRKKGIDGP